MDGSSVSLVSGVEDPHILLRLVVASLVEVEALVVEVELAV